MLRLFLILLLLTETVFSQNDLVSLSIDEAVEYGIKDTMKTGVLEKGIKENNDILEDDLTIIGIGK